MAVGEEVFWMTATEMARAIRERRLSAVEGVTAHLARVETINPRVNAIVTLDAERALRRAKEADDAIAHGKILGPLHGVPVAHKDLEPTKGVRTTFGSKLYEDFIPTENSLLVERQEQAGAISLGKTNTPEFGAGSQTFNAVFGTTRNPYDLARTCGGSSGGSAVAVATGMVAMADGSDMFGSIRCPSNYCNLVGLRPSIGRVPRVPRADGWNSMSVVGPIARTVEDVALFMSVISGPDSRDPLSLDGTVDFLAPLGRDLAGVHVAYSADFGGLPVAPEVADVVRTSARVFEELGCVVEEACPDFRDANEIAMTLRAYSAELRLGRVMEEHPGILKPTLVGDIEAGRRLRGPDLGRAARLRTELFQRMHRFMEKYEFLLLPVNQVPPFPVDQEYVAEINGLKMASYVDWVRSLSYITVTAHPAMSVPAGFTSGGLPVGVQIVGRYRDEFALLQAAYAFEQATQVGLRRPPLL
ncbi:MAG: amidase [Candidimonas sp.]|nr:MAG: amidase [Candidimonas sp.]